MSPGKFKGVTRVLGVSRALPGSFKTVYGKFQKRFKGLSRRLEVGFKGVLFWF